MVVKRQYRSVKRTQHTERQRAYPIAPVMTQIGVVFALFVALMLGDLLTGLTLFTLFAIVGYSWRSDLLPILPAVLAYQVVAISVGYWFYVIQGHYPGGGDTRLIGYAVALSALAVTCVLVGFRFGARLFRRWLSWSLKAETKWYDLNRLFWITLALSTLLLVYEIAPINIWYGASQIITNLLMLRYVPYVILLLAVFKQRKGLHLAVAATLAISLPELLTGFSRFKEIFLFFAIAALSEWRPWLRSDRQKAFNLRVAAIAAAAIVLTIGAMLIWTSGLKNIWREQIWLGPVEEQSSVLRLSVFFALAGDSVRQFEFADTVEQAAARLSSGTLYFAYTLELVPNHIPYEHGLLLRRALENLVPRVLFPEKAVLGGDSWLVRKYAGIDAAGDERGVSIGLGWPAEFYIDFGIVGVVGLSIVYGIIAAGCLAIVSYFARNREIFFGLIAALLSSSLMSVDGSFAKLVPGLLQKTMISAMVLALIGPGFLKFVQDRKQGSPKGTIDSLPNR